MGCKVALIQDRGVLGGNGVQWKFGYGPRETSAEGNSPESERSSRKSPIRRKVTGTYEEFEDAKKERIVRAEKNVDLQLYHHAFKVEKRKEDFCCACLRHTKWSSDPIFASFCGCDRTRHHRLRGADHTMTEKGRMGMSNMWAWANEEKAISFPDTPWALDLNMADFPYPRDFHGQWFWESGYDKDPLGMRKESVTGTSARSSAPSMP